MRTPEEIVEYKKAWTKRNRAKINAQNRVRYAADPEMHRARWSKCAAKPEQKENTVKRQARWREANPDKVREQGREHAKRRRLRDPEGVHAYDNERHHRDQVAKFLKLSRIRAKKKGFEHNLEAEDIVVPEKCPVFGVTLRYGLGVGRCRDMPTLDRIDNAKGYIKGNVVVVSWRANRLKSDATMAELQAIVDFYRPLT